MKKLRTWTQAEELFLVENISKIPMAELAEKLQRTERAINLHLHQQLRGKKPHIPESRNMLIKAFELKFVNHRWFRPTREFYSLANITQKRYNAIIKGQNKVTNEEFLRIAKVLNLACDEILDCRQLTLFDE